MIKSAHSEALLPPDAKLQASKGFYLYFEQVSRLLNATARQADKSRIPQVELMEAVGLSKYRVESLVSLAAGMCLIKPVVYLPTDFGLLVWHHDPFFDNPGTLWICHYLISSEQRYVIWNRMANEVLPQASELVGNEVATEFADLRDRFSEKSVAKHVPKELRTFFNAYTEQAFRKLYYLREVDEGTYALTDSPAPVPPGAFLATLLIYRNRFQSGASGLEVPAICTADHSPGRLLHLGEARVRALLNELHEAGRLAIEAKANLDQVRFRPGQTWVEAMQAYYETEHR